MAKVFAPQSPTPTRVRPSQERSPMELHYNAPDRPGKTVNNDVRNLPNVDQNKAKGD